MLLLFDENIGDISRSLFANGEQGLWIDPSDFSTMFQDAAGTTPVTAAGQPVGLIRDKSGRGNHASQSTDSSRPTLEQDANGLYHLKFDGVDDFLVTGSINFTATNKMTVFAAFRKLSDTLRAIICELSTDVGSNNGAFRVGAPSANATANVNFTSRGTTSQATSFTVAAPVSFVYTGIGDISGDVSQMRLNGAVANTNTGDQGTGNYGNYPVYIGARTASFQFSGRIYGVIIRGAASTASQIVATESYLNGRSRAF